MIETERLTLRRFTLDDAEFVIELLNQPSFLRFIGDKGVRDRQSACTYLREGPLASYSQHGFGLMLVREHGSDRPVGMSGLLQRPYLAHPDLGFAFLPRCWGLGYATESGRAVIDQGWSLHRLPRILAITSPDNLASQRVLTRLGMQPAGETLVPNTNQAVPLFAIASPSLK